MASFQIYLIFSFPRRSTSVHEWVALIAHRARLAPCPRHGQSRTNPVSGLPTAEARERGRKGAERIRSEGRRQKGEGGERGRGGEGKGREGEGEKGEVTDWRCATAQCGAEVRIFNLQFGFSLLELPCWILLVALFLHFSARLERLVQHLENGRRDQGRRTGIYISSCIA